MIDSMNPTPTVLIYVHDLLGGSKTFIKSQAESLVHYRGHYVAGRRVKGLAIDAQRAIVVNRGGLSGKVAEALFRTLGVCPRLYRLARRLDPVLIHAHHGTAGPTALGIARQLDIPLIVTFHGKDATMSEQEAAGSHRGRALLRKKQALIEGAAAFIAVSDYIKQALIERGYPADKVIVHRNGIDTAYFRPDPAIHRENVVLFVGRFAEKKGGEYLIRAMQRVQQKLPDAELVFIGDGPLRASLEDQAAQQLGRYRFLGFQPGHVVREWLNRAAVFAAPSVTAGNGDCEGLPTVLLEAQAMELPVVSTYHSGIPEGVRDGVTALLSQERDWETLSEQLFILLSNGDTARRLGQAAREFMCSDFELGRQTAGLEDIYRQAIASAPRSAMRAAS